MEEILASIRRIIADDQEAPKPAPAPKSVPPAAFATPLPPAPAPLEEEDVLELGEVAQPVRLATRPIPLSDEPPDIAFRDIEGDPQYAYDQVKGNIQDQFILSDATLSHHHAVGTEHARWLEADISAPGVQLINGLFNTLDPGHNLNPGKITTT